MVQDTGAAVFGTGYWRCGIWYRILALRYLVQDTGAAVFGTQNMRDI